MDEQGAYELFRQGTELLEAGDCHAATIPLSRAKEMVPDKDSVREAYGRALRRELAAGLGFRGRLKSLWMLPPQPREVLDALRPRRRRAYTA